LREAVTRNLGVKLLALGLATAMWVLIAPQRQGEVTEIKFSTPLVFKNIPANLELMLPATPSVSVLVRTRRARANVVNPNQFQAVVDLANQLPGSFEYRLTESNIGYDNVAPPDGMTVLQISPAEVTLTLEEAVQKVVPVEARLAGETPGGYAVESVRITPERVSLQGPRSALAKVTRAYTRPLDIQDLRSNVEMLAYLDLPPLVRLGPNQKPLFRAQVAVSGNPGRAVLRDVPIVFENGRDPYRASRAAINLHVEGPREVLATLSSRNVTAVLDLAKFPPGDYRGLSPRVILPQGVRILRQWPIVDLTVSQRKSS
jgi:hypothetical protein